MYIRNHYEYWNVGTHFFISNEDSNTVAEGLRIVRQFANHWNPRYFLSDQSNIESNSIKAAFSGLKNGEQECDIIFCTVHIMRIWMSKIYDKKTRQKMVQAMHKRTKIGCEDLVQRAINKCENLVIKRYISRNYTKNIHQWALWARQHSPLLLQVTSTNALESYHSELKRTTLQLPWGFRRWMAKEVHLGPTMLEPEHHGEPFLCICQILYASRDNRH